jgi:hypothetical protein
LAGLFDQSVSTKGQTKNHTCAPPIASEAIHMLAFQARKPKGTRLKVLNMVNNGRNPLNDRGVEKMSELGFVGLNDRQDFFNHANPKIL